MRQVHLLPSFCPSHFLRPPVFIIQGSDLTCKCLLIGKRVQTMGGGALLSTIPLKFKRIVYVMTVFLYI